MKRTPGPWEWQSAVKATDGSHVRDYAFLSPGVLTTNPYTEITGANARLIAKAPELYDLVYALAYEAVGENTIRDARSLLSAIDGGRE